MLSQSVIVEIANALIGLVAVGAGIRLLAGVDQMMRVEVAPRKEGLVALITFIRPLGHVWIVGAHMGAQIRFGWPRFAADAAVKDARLRFARMHAGVRDQLGAQHETPIAQLAGKWSFRRVQRCEMIAQAVTRCETLRAHLALIAQPVAQSVHRYHVQLQLKVARKFLLTLAARTQRFWCPATRRATCCCPRLVAWRPLALGHINWRWHAVRSAALLLRGRIACLQLLQRGWQMDGRVQCPGIPAGKCRLWLLVTGPKQIRQIHGTCQVRETRSLLCI